MSSMKMDFDLFAEASRRKKEFNALRLKCQQAALKWLFQQEPSGIGLNVPTRLTKFQVDIGAFWSAPDRKKVMRPRKTVIIETRFDRHDCWPDIGERAHLLEKLRELKDEKQRFEAVIRRREPELRIADNLFEEIETWDYEASRNQDYRRFLKKLEEIQRSLYEGSRFELIHRAHVADFLYLAVPRHLIDPSELANGWGLLYIDDNREIEEVKKAQQAETAPESKLHFIQNLAASCLKNTLFAAGLNIGKNNQISCSPPPRRQHKKI